MVNEVGNLNLKSEIAMNGRWRLNRVEGDLHRLATSSGQACAGVSKEHSEIAS